MNARQQLKPKTIRLAILLALADGAITTIDDLQIKTDEPRKKVAGAVYPAAVEGLIKRMRDDVTGAPAYQITADGRKYLAKYSGSVEEPTAPAAPDESARQKSEAVAVGALETAMPGFAAEVIAQKDAEIARLVEDRDCAWRELQEIRLAIDANSEESTLDEAKRVVFELAEAKASIELSRLARAVTTAGYVTQRPGKPLARFTKAEIAQARAMSSARAGKRAQVFALVPVGAAVPDAEWVAA